MLKKIWESKWFPIIVVGIYFIGIVIIRVFGTSEDNKLLKYKQEVLIEIEKKSLLLVDSLKNSIDKLDKKINQVKKERAQIYYYYDKKSDSVVNLPDVQKLELLSRNIKRGSSIRAN